MIIGKAILLIEKQALVSVEFDRKMNPEGYGSELFKGLIDTSDENDFYDLISDFNEQFFGYKELLIEKISDEIMYDTSMYQVIDFNVDYFKRFPADWLFFKNLTGKDVVFRQKNTGNLYILRDEDSIVFEFGEIYR